MMVRKVPAANRLFVHSSLHSVSLRWMGGSRAVWLSARESCKSWLIERE
jgi:hypothetical protein